MHSLASEELHSEQGEDDHEEGEEEEKRHDGFDAVDQRQTQVLKRLPVPVLEVQCMVW